jgi:DNA-binding NarL/FixJ family response regulator
MGCRILLADDHELVRSGLKTVLESEPDLTVCGESGDGIDTIRLAARSKPDIIIADPWLPGANGVILTRRILESRPHQRVLIFGTFDSNEPIRDLLQAGVKGVVLKTQGVEDILDAIRALRMDRTYFTSAIESVILREYLGLLPKTAPEQRAASLTLRELEVAQLLAEGKVTKEIGELLGTSVKTAATHRSNLMRKIGVHNLAQMTLYAISHHLIEAPTFQILAKVVELKPPETQREHKAAA